jgi:hypothetical protein
VLELAEAALDEVAATVEGRIDAPLDPVRRRGVGICALAPAASIRSRVEFAS